MSVLDFPTSPTNGQYYGGYIWNSSNETWDSAYAPRAATIPITSPNYIINAAFDINQRNFTSTTANATYGHDRWKLVAVGGTTTYSNQTFAAGTVLGGYEAKNYARIVTTGQTGNGPASALRQFIESVRTLAGQTVTVSFWAKAASGTPSVAVAFAQGFGTGGSAGVDTHFGKVTLSTSWTRYTVTGTIPNISGKTIVEPNDSLILWLAVSAGSDWNSVVDGLGIQSNTFDFWGVQVEVGAAPTEFRRNAPSIQAELAACQRYYWRQAPGAIAPIAGQTVAVVTTEAYGDIQLPVPMRVPPASSEFSNLQLNNNGQGQVAITNLFVASSTRDRVAYGCVTPASLVAQRAYTVITSSTAGFLGFSAEL